MSIDGMYADGSGFDTLAGTGDIGFSFVSTTLVAAYLLCAFDCATIVVNTCVGHICTDYCVVSTYVYFADASFEASAFY